MRYNLTEERQYFDRWTMRCLKYILFNAGLLILLAFFAWGDELKENRIVATVDPDGIQRVEILGGGYYFEPNIIIVKVNVPVELRVKKTGGITPHDIVLNAPEAGINFAENLSGESKMIKFIPTEAGKYPFECTKRLLFFKSHKDQGMHGLLEVVE